MSTDWAGRIEVPSTPSHHLSMRSANAFAFASTPRTGIGTAASVPGSGRIRETPSRPETHLAEGSDGYSAAKTGISSHQPMIHGPASMALTRANSENQSGVCFIAAMDTVVNMTRLIFDRVSNSGADYASSCRKSCISNSTPGSPTFFFPAYLSLPVLNPYKSACETSRQRLVNL